MSSVLTTADSSSGRELVLMIRADSNRMAPVVSKGRVLAQGRSISPKTWGNPPRCSARAIHRPLVAVVPGSMSFQAPLTTPKINQNMTLTDRAITNGRAERSIISLGRTRPVSNRSASTARLRTNW